MTRRRLFRWPLQSVLVGALLQALTPASYAQPAGAQAGTTARTTLTVTLPHPDAELTIDGQATVGTETTRRIEVNSLARGADGTLTLAVSWNPNTYTTMTRTRTVTVRGGESLPIDLSRDDPTDRVRVIYVPTPHDIAAEMARLAGVGPRDVVFEPGCGDARTLIAAVKMGAQRGVGIDIDPERVADSRAKVKEAGLDSRVEIRLGDALDIPDLSTATVVLLYMGDHFDMLIRPALWRDLPVGARIVSHRFRMGDWEPDRTVMVTSEEGGDYELHLWTITEEVKRRAASGGQP